MTHRHPLPSLAVCLHYGCRERMVLPPRTPVTNPGHLPILSLSMFPHQNLHHPSLHTMKLETTKTLDLLHGRQQAPEQAAQAPEEGECVSGVESCASGPLPPGAPRDTERKPQYRTAASGAGIERWREEEVWGAGNVRLMPDKGSH